MPTRQPRAQLATHDVTNQPLVLEDVNLFASDALLRDACHWSGAALYTDRLMSFGARVGAAETQLWAAQANRHVPSLQPFDRFGHRLDEVEFHPAYHALMNLGLAAGVASAAWNVGESGHALHAALMFLMGEADYGVCCPMSMTYAVVPALRHEPEIAAVWEPRVTREAYDPRMLPAAEKHAATMGMAMTEKQGGSDVRTNTTRAARLDDGGYLLTGHKWFCSAPMSDAFLALAQAPDGLTCFLVPRWRPDGTRNEIELQRLKDKLGDRSNASSEVEYRGAWARRVGAEGRGVRTIIDMVQLTRFDCIIGAATQMRHAAALAAWHVRHRTAFDRRLIDQPLMRAVLADVAIDVESAVALMFRVARALDATDDPREAALARIALPLAKYLTTKRAPVVVVEAMECLGGAGYVEESPLPRIFRQSPVNGIWEGSGNVIALDVLRALQREPDAQEALFGELSDIAHADREFSSQLDAVKSLLNSSSAQPDARRAVECLALGLAGATLLRHAPRAVADAFILRRLRERSLTFGAGNGTIETQALLDRIALEI